MTIASFSLVNKVPITVYRHSEGSRVDGHWVEGTESEVVIYGNVHPFSDYQVMLQPEADRTKSWMWLFTTDVVRQKKEGVGGFGADRFEWEGDLYEIMAVSTYSMKIRDHRECKCVRIERTPN